MGKRFFYEFNGNVFLEANDKAEAEKLVTGISLNNYLIHEKVHQIDEHYVSFDLSKREEQLGTYLHPFNDQDEYQEFKMRERRYEDIFNEFLHGKFDKNELLKRMTEAEKENLDDYAIVDEISMVDLVSKKLKGVRHCFVD
jgi:hypothetical protein